MFKTITRFLAAAVALAVMPTAAVQADNVIPAPVTPATGVSAPDPLSTTVADPVVTADPEAEVRSQLENFEVNHNRVVTPTMFVDLEGTAPAVGIADQKLSDERLEAGTVSTRLKVRANAAGTAVYGYLFGRDYSARYGSVQSYRMTLVKGEEGVDTIFGVYGMSTAAVLVTIDESAGTVSIAPQTIYNHSSYGDIIICPWDPSTGKYAPTSNITGTIAADGTITLIPWGVFVKSGTSAGGFFDRYTTSEWHPQNAVITVFDRDSVSTERPSYIEQVSEDQIIISDMVSVGTGYVYARLRSDKTLQVTPQKLYTNAYYGDAYCYSYDPVAKKTSTTNPIQGRSTALGFDLDGWVCAFKASTSTVVYYQVATNVATSASIVYPDPISADFTGAGTQDDPYVIKTVNDMLALSQQVEDGNTYAGRYFVLGADIDMSTLTRTWVPVGTSDYAFSGSFDGKGYTISGLSYDGKGATYTGLFGNLGLSASVSNFNVTGFTLTSTGASLGTVAGYNLGTVKGIKVTSTNLTGSQMSTGGIVAENRGTVSDCYFYGNISATGDIGGITGMTGYYKKDDGTYQAGIIRNSHVNGSIVASGYYSSLYHDLGGISGFVVGSEDAPTVIEDCSVAGVVQDTYGYALMGGISALTSTAHFNRCVNAATVMGVRYNSESDPYCGGLFGSVSLVEANDCVNAGLVYKITPSASYPVEYCGGLAGYVSVTYSTTSGQPTVMKNLSHFYNCYNSGQVITNTPIATSGMYGSTFYSTSFAHLDPIADLFHNSYFDNQVNDYDDNEWARPTSFFTSGLPEGFSSDVWSQESGCYPVPKSADTEAKAFAGAAFKLSNDEHAQNMKSQATLAAASDIQWRIYSSSGFVTSTTSLSLSGTAATTGTEYGTNMVVAALPNSYYKIMYISTVPSTAFDGNGTKESPYLIKSAADFETLHSAVYTYGQSHNHDYFSVVNDIDFTGSSFKGVGAGSTSAYFSGTLEGNGHTLHNFSLVAGGLTADGSIDTSVSYYYGSLFNIIDAHASISNLNMAADCSLTTYHYGGAFAGLNQGKISGCRNYANITSVGAYTAGICGYLYEGATVTDCYNGGDITGGGNGTAGIVGLACGAIERVQNDGDILCTGSYGYVGGIAGSLRGSVNLGVNNGNVVGPKCIGGIAGEINSNYEAFAITNTLNNGLTHVNTDVTTIGGIAGSKTGTSFKLENVYFDASVNTTGACSGFGMNGATEMFTKTLVSGNAVGSLPTDEFDYAAGKYPVLKMFASETRGATLRTMYMALDDNETSINIVKNVGLSQPEGIDWKVTVGKYFVVNADTLAVTLPTELVLASDTITASVGSVVKEYRLGTMPIVFDGKGSVESPFIIANIDDFNKIVDFIEITEADFRGYHFRLTADLDFTDSIFRPIAKGSTAISATNTNLKYSDKLVFNGDFDGYGHTISGINIDDATYSTSTGQTSIYYGVFGVVGANGQVRNLTVDKSTFATYRYSGSIAGKVYGTISNCHSSATISGATTQAYLGGIASYGYATAVIEDCTFSGTISNVNAKQTYVGGILGTMSEEGVIIRRCVNYGTVEGQSYVCGITPYLAGTIEDCENRGTITSAGAWAAGIFGAYKIANGTNTVKGCVNYSDIKTGSSTNAYAAGIGGFASSTGSIYYTTVSDCVNYGNIYGQRYLGGIISRVVKGVIIENCVNEGNIEFTGYGYSGGIAADSQVATEAAPSYIRGCVNKGNIYCDTTIIMTSNIQYVGGIVGQNYCGVEDCYNTGRIDVRVAGYSSSSEKYVWDIGGICGYNYGAGPTSGVRRCVNFGDLYVDGQCAGGICGFHGITSSPISGCVNLGNLTTTFANNQSASFGRGCLGGIVGESMATEGVIENCYNMGTLTFLPRSGKTTGTPYIGGVLGIVQRPVNLRGCYNAGKLVGADGWSWHPAHLTSHYYTNYNTLDEGSYANFYDTDVNSDITPTDIDLKYVGRPTAEMPGIDLGDAYTYNKAAYPTLTALTAQYERVNLAAVMVLPTIEDDKLDDLHGPVYIGNLDGLLWSASDEVMIDGGTATFYRKGEAWLKATTPTGEERTFNVYVTEPSGIDSVGTDAATVVGSMAFDLNGRRVTYMTPGQVYVIVTKYADGTVTTSKVVAK